MVRLVAMVAVVAGCGFRIDATVADGGADVEIDAPDIDAPPDAPGPPIMFLQTAAHFENTVMRVDCTFGKPQGDGNTNVVIVSWFDANNDVASLFDSAGNTYVRLPITVSGPYSQRLYVASRIHSGTGNKVSVTFAQNMSFPKLRILEFSGLAADPYEAGAAMGGNSGTASAGPIVTSTPHVLLLATNVVNANSMPLTPFAGVDFSDGDLVETLELHAPATTTATASLAPSANWVMVVAALRGR